MLTRSIELVLQFHHPYINMTHESMQLLCTNRLEFGIPKVSELGAVWDDVYKSLYTNDLLN